jgi:uncharacterized lipoprotein YmbA
MPDDHIVIDGYDLIKAQETALQLARNYVLRMTQKQRRIDELTQRVELLEQQLTAARGDRDE